MNLIRSLLLEQHDDIRQTALSKGYAVGPVFHASTYGTWNTLDPNESVFGKAGYGSYFSNAVGAKLFAEYGEKFQMSQNWKGVPKNVRILSVYLKLDNPLMVDHVDEMKPWLDRNQQFGVGREYQQIRPGPVPLPKSLGYDGVITAETTAPKVHKIQGLRIFQRHDPRGVEFPVWVVYDSFQVKLSTETYDDDGELIPLEKRFDVNNPDMRY
jgi:hypothetical protein